MTRDRVDWPQPGDPDRLNGWKEIATFLNKGVRTAQRWEREYGLPIKRLGREGGEVIFASRLQIAAWLETEARRRAEQSLDRPDATLTAQPDCSFLSGPERRPANWKITAALLVLLAAATGGASVWLQSDASRWPAGITLTADEFIASDSAGQELWRYSVGHRTAGTLSLWQPGPRGVNAAVADLDGDDIPEVVVAATSPDRSPAMAFHLLNADGSVRRIIRPGTRYTIGADVFAGPWIPHRLFLGRTRDGQTPIYLTFIDIRLFPTLLIEITPTGDVVAEYFSNGYIDFVGLLDWQGAPALFVGAANNEHKGASLSIFPGGHATGAAPATIETYRCMTCPTGGPAEFVVFPRRCLSKVGNQTASIAEAMVNAQGRLAVRVVEGGANSIGLPASDVWYVLSQDLTPLRAEIAFGLRLEHASWHQRGLIDHALSPDRDGPDLYPVLRWSRGRFVDLPPGDIIW
jgi:hypothetical protein